MCKEALPATGRCMSIYLSVFFFSNPKTQRKIKSKLMNPFLSLSTVKAYLTEGHCLISFLLLLTTLVFHLVSSQLLKLYVKYCFWWLSSYLCYPIQAISLLLLIIMGTHDIWRVLSPEGEIVTLNQKRDVRCGVHLGERR